MPIDHRAELARIKTFPQLIAYLRDEMGWPIARDSFEEVDDLFYDFTADELGIDPKTAAKIQEIKRLRPLSPQQPWGIFFVKFEPKKLPVVALRRILGQVALKKRASANSAERAAWAADDLLFVSNYGVGDERQISFAHFSRAQDGHDLPTLKVLGWDNLDTALHLDAVARELTEHLAWPNDDDNAEAWRTRWRAAFTLRHREVVSTSKELSIRLAELARNIRDRISTALAIETDKGPLTRLMKAFQTALVHDLDAEGFADMYAQTIAYGLLSARIADPHKKTADDFAAHMRTNPFLRELMETFLKVGGRRGKAGGPGIDFDELGVSEVVELLDDANMEAVVRDFGDRNPQEDPVIHFYELFLKEYDAKKRMQRGVFYTPRPVVSYIVRSVDELLRTEFGLADGLADTATWGEMAKRHKDLKIPDGVSPDQGFVQILDPATGTGTFLVEVIDLIHKTLAAKWKAQGHGEKKIDALWNEYVPKHLLTRLHGYELLMAPYAIAHLKIGLKLYETGYRFGSDERARVYLTNALEPSHDFSGTFQFAIPALAHEAAAVNEIKRRGRFTVLVGNPPYSGISANMNEAAQELVQRYRQVEGTPLQERKLWLQNDYVKFLGLAHRLVMESGVGSIGYITDNSYLDGPTFRGVRWNLLADFTCIDVLNLHGSAKKANTDPAATVDQNVFDITQGVAVLTAVRLERGVNVRFRTASLFGRREQKYERLLTLTRGDQSWAAATPSSPFYLFAGDQAGGKDEYRSFVSVEAAFLLRSVGVQTSRDHLAIGFTRRELIDKIVEFANPKTTDAVIRERFFPGKKVANYKAGDTRGWSLSKARKAIAAAKSVDDGIVRITYRPLDIRYVFNVTSLVDWPRPEVSEQMRSGRNVALCVLRRTENARVYDYFSVSRHTISNHQASLKDGTYLLPLYIDVEGGHGELFGKTESRKPNLSRPFLEAFADALGVPPAGPHGLPARVTPEDLLHFAYAVFHSPGYRNRYAEFLKLDFPRLPLCRDLELFRALARLGGELVSLHVLESPKVERFITEYLGGRGPEVGTVSWAKNTVWIDKAQTTGFKGVREEVWNFHIGGYQVCEKWLKDRKGRTLSKDDIVDYQKIVVALAETIRLMKEIDEVIEQHGGWPGAFQTGEPKAATAEVVPFRPRTVEPKPEERYVTCVPLVPLKAAAGAFGDPQHVEDDGFEWVAVESRHRPRKGMFVAQVVGKSMEPAIPDGAYCLFRAPVEGTRQGKTVLVQLRDTTDRETGQRYTVKRYESEKSSGGDSWRHQRITLKPVNPDFEAIVLEGGDEGQFAVVAELVEVLGSGA